MSHALTRKDAPLLFMLLPAGAFFLAFFLLPMLRLFFTDAAPERALTLAKQRIGELTGMLQFLEQPGLGGTQPAHRRVLSWGRMTVRADLAFWQSILDDIEGQL